MVNSLTDILSEFVQNAKDLFTFYVPNAMLLLFVTFFSILILLRILGRY